jgi:HEAT repeats
VLTISRDHGRRAIASAAFERFRFSFFEDPTSARDDLDTISLGQLEGEERECAEDMLVRYLPDARGVIGLGVLRARRAELELMRLFEAEEREWRDAKRDPAVRWPSSMMIYLAQALWRIRPDPRWTNALSDILADAAEAVHRWGAAAALCGVRDPGVVPALIKALDDQDSLVRYHAGHALLSIYGPIDALPPNDPQHMTYRVMSNDPARHAGGKRDILAAIAGQPIAPP